MEIKDRIKQLRKSKNLTLKGLAEQINVAYSNISDWERGRAKPSADALIALADFFNVTTDWLLTGKGRGPEEKEENREENKEEQKKKKPDMIYSFTFEAPESGISPIEENIYELKRAIRDYLQSICRVSHESGQDENNIIKEDSIEKEKKVIQLAKKLQSYIENYIEQPLTSERKKQLINTLTDDEVYLLINYRKLTDKQKGKIEGIIETMLDYNKKIMSSTFTSGEESVTNDPSITA
ncbi:helix-turn-helix domain-containing protein [Caloranaerobacter sp. DY30410]|uniref:helix-turn-helix domain-containing protein n=1 Tax=Caloranaerobacter sp. DY30410 TaxID=3238305 RepID=UPI003CFF256B